MRTIPTNVSNNDSCCCYKCANCLDKENILAELQFKVGEDFYYKNPHMFELVD